MATKDVKVHITPLMVKKVLKALPKCNAYVQMATLSEAMLNLSMTNTANDCLDDARTACHEFINTIFDQEETDVGF